MKAMIDSTNRATSSAHRKEVLKKTRASTLAKTIPSSPSRATTSRPSAQASITRRTRPDCACEVSGGIAAVASFSMTFSSRTHSPLDDRTAVLSPLLSSQPEPQPPWPIVPLWLFRARTLPGAASSGDINS